MSAASRHVAAAENITRLSQLFALHDPISARDLGLTSTAPMVKNMQAYSRYRVRGARGGHQDPCRRFGMAHRRQEIREAGDEVDETH
jgi:hypothetical protein